MDRLSEIPLPGTGYQYDMAVLSADGKTIAASTSTPNLYEKGPHVYDDAIYIIPLENGLIKKLKNYWGDAQVSRIYWSLDGKSIINSIVKCPPHPEECKSVHIRRNLKTDESEEIPNDTPFVLPPSLKDKVKKPLGLPWEREQQCEGRTLKAVPESGNCEGSCFKKPHDVRIVVYEKNNSESTVLTIKNRIESTPHVRPLTPVAPQFTSDCKYIVFNLGDDILVTDRKGNSLFPIGSGGPAYLFKGE